MSIRSVVVFLCVFVLDGEFCSGQTQSVADAREFKLELFEQAVKLKESKEQPLLTTEAAISLGLAHEPRWKSVAPELFLERFDAQTEFRACRLTRRAIFYRRFELARKLFDRLSPTIEKLELAVWMSFSFGFESKKAETLALFQELQEWRGKRVTWIGGKPGEDEVQEISSERLGQLRKEMLCAYHCGLAGSGRKVGPTLLQDVPRKVFRDLVRMHRVNYFVRKGKASEALEAIRTLDSIGLRFGATYLAAEELLEMSLDSDTKRELGVSVIASLNALADDAGVIARQQPLESDMPFRELDRLECSEPVTSLVDDVFSDDPAYVDVVKLCIRLGICEDGLEVAADLNNQSLRRRWFDAVLQRKENVDEFEDAWAIRERIREEFSYTKEPADQCLERLIRASVEGRQFEVAVVLMGKLHDQEVAAELRDYLAVRRGNDADLERARELAPELFATFDQQLAAVKPDKQLEWLLDQSVVFRNERKLEPLFGRIVREVEERRDSKSRQFVAKKADSFLRSFTKPNKVSLQLLREIVRVLNVELFPRDQTSNGITTILDRLERQSTSADQLKRYYGLLVRLAKKIKDTDDRDYSLANIARVMAIKGERERVVELNRMISDKTILFRSLLECATAYPPATRPVRSQPVYLLGPLGGFEGAGFF